jgi:hypothetical protein
MKIMLRFPRRCDFLYDLRLFAKDVCTLPLQLICLFKGHGFIESNGTKYCVYCGRADRIKDE